MDNFPVHENITSSMKASASGKRSRDNTTNAPGHQKQTRLSQLKDSERAQLLAGRYEDVCLHTESNTICVYRGGLWCPVSQAELGRMMTAIYEEHHEPYNCRVITNAADALKLAAVPMGKPSRDLMGFANGVLDLKSGEFSPHSPDNWLTAHNGIEYTSSAGPENIHEHAPHFHKWLAHAAEDDPCKMKRILAALYMIMTNRHDWQMFIEITGAGGSGKSTFTQIATLLVGKVNTVSSDMKALDDPRGRAQLAHARLIVLPDQPRYTGEGTGIKKITGGDPVEIDRKYEQQFTTTIRAVVLTTNNEPMIFTERAGGVARRRVIFRFDNTVSDADRDPDLADRIAAEIPVVVRHLLDIFSDPEVARNLLKEQRDSEEALGIKQETNPVTEFCARLTFLDNPRGIMMGGGGQHRDITPRNSLYQLYTAFLEYTGRGKSLSVSEFGKAMKESAKAYGHEYMTRTVDGRKQTNVTVPEGAFEFPS